MAASGTLYTCKDNFRSRNILIAAEYGKAHVEVRQEPPQFVFGQTNRSSDFLSKFPLGKVPAFEGSDGVTLTETAAIAYFLAGGALKGKSEGEKAKILNWTSFVDNEIVPLVSTLTFPCLGLMPFNKQTYEKALSDLKIILASLNETLVAETFLVANRISLADIAVFTSLIGVFTHILEPALRKPYPSFMRWFDTIRHQANVLKVVGEVKLCEKTAQFDAATYAQLQGKGDAAGKRTDKKAGKKEDKKEDKKDTPKKEEKKQAPEESGAELTAAPPKKNPFDDFPAGTFVMDDFKRCYSNEDTAISIPYFWQKFDPQNYSIWYCEYNYPEDLTQVFMSCNLISGMMQRLDNMRSQAFASMCLFGEDHCSTISGVWVWRGHELAFTLSDDWQVDYESYQWKKLDPADASTKTLVNEYLAWEGQFGGKKFNQGKIFK